ncbi:MAG: cell division protein ZipA [Pseudomonadota bacterium]
MDNLRLILILIGLVVLALIWFFHQPRGKRPPAATRRERQRIEPDLNAGGNSQGVVEVAEDDQPDSNEPHQTALPNLNDDDTEVDGDQASTAPIGAERREPVWSEPEPSANAESPAAAKKAQASSPRPKSIPTGEDPKVVTLYVRAREGRRISGVSLLDAAIKAGLRFGDMNIFHRSQRGSDQPVFSMANLTAPGSFDPSAWNLFETPGVTLFMALPGPISALEAWDAMLATSQRLAELIDADLLDDAQCLITRQRIAQIREDMREYDRKNDSRLSG